MVRGMLASTEVRLSLPTDSPPDGDQREVNDQSAYLGEGQIDRTGWARRSHHETV